MGSNETECRISNVECRMSNMVRKRLEPCQKSLQRLSDIALCARKRKEGKWSAIRYGRKYRRTPKIPRVPTGLAGNERSVSRAKRQTQQRLICHAQTE